MLATDHSLSLRQIYYRQAPKLAVQVGRYAHAKHFKLMKKKLCTLKSSVHREVNRQPGGNPPIFNSLHW